MSGERMRIYREKSWRLQLKISYEDLALRFPNKLACLPDKLTCLPDKPVINKVIVGENQKSNYHP
jgi:hypothetical protein